MSFWTMLLIVLPLSVFLLIVAPVWLVLHYRSSKATAKELTNAEREKLEKLSKTAHEMSQRIQTLESILDAESPNWRNR